MRAHVTPQAEIDLEEVGDYIALDNARRAVSFIREIRQHCEKIAVGVFIQSNGVADFVKRGYLRQT
jgi:plasmid stabilization system protein ParE